MKIDDKPNVGGRLVMHLNKDRVIIVEHGGEQLFIYRSENNPHDKVCFTGSKSFYIYSSKTDRYGNPINEGEKSGITTKRMKLAYDRGADGKKS